MPERRFKRLPSSILIDLYETNSTVPKGRGCIVDVSLGGMAIETEASLPIGDELFLRIFIHQQNSAPLELYANVMRVQQVDNLFHYGLRYTRLGFFGKFKLRRSIDRLVQETSKSSTTTR